VVDQTGNSGSLAAIPYTGSETLAVLLARRAAEQGERIFLIFEDARGDVNRYTYAEMDRRANRNANLLRRLGVVRGERFHVHLVNCPEFYDCWFAAAKLGAIIVPTNPLSTTDELAYVLNHAECRVSITEPDLLATVTAARDQSPSLRRVLLARAGESVAEAQSLSEAISAERDTFDGEPCGRPLDPVSMLYTSGTTSRPKGVLVTNANYLAVGEAVAQHLRVRPDDRLLIVLPLFHGNAQYYSSMSAIVTGASIALVERFSASRWGRQAARLEATVASLFAAPIRMILAQPEDAADGLNRLRVALFAQNITAEQLDEFERRFNCPLLQLYGMTETVLPPAMNPLYGERRNMSIGRPGLWARLRIVDDKGNDVPTGESGQLLVHGEPGRTLMAGYFKNPEVTASTIRDGWLYTGDNARTDADGYLYFVDRSKDMIKRAGENVASSEVERAVNDHPAVFESVAIGVPDVMRDEAIKVFVVLHPKAHATGEEIIVWCAERLAKFKVPSYVAFVDSLPRTSVGKVQKHLLPRESEVEAAQGNADSSTKRTKEAAK
jgi:carnitine-CoA ligase